MTIPDSLIRTGIIGAAAQVNPQAGMQYPLATPADPTGKVTVGAAQLVSLALAAYSAVPASCTFSTQYITNCTLDVTLSAFTGGVSPTITILFERQGADGVWYPVAPPSGGNAISYTAAQIPAVVTVDIGTITQAVSASGANPYLGSFHNVFTPMSRVRWTTTGSPTSVTLSLSVCGR